MSWRKTISLSTVLPRGWINTWRNRGDFKDEQDMIAKGKNVPIGRVGQPSDFGGICLLLCSEAGSYITGPDNLRGRRADGMTDKLVPFCRPGQTLALISPAIGISPLTTMPASISLNFSRANTSVRCSWPAARPIHRACPRKPPRRKYHVAAIGSSLISTSFATIRSASTGPTVIGIDCVRDGILREEGFHDPYYQLKHHDNELVLSLLPVICRDLDEHREPTRLQAAILGALAGNIFDMGVAVTARRMMERSLSFRHTRDNMPRRPWVVDDFDALEQRVLHGAVHHKAVIFVDNAGADFMLGMLPLSRYLAQRGTEVVIVANALATLNDMTITDINELWPAILRAEPSLGRLPIRVVSSGTGEPLLDLSRVSPELNAAAEDADLVILEGNGPRPGKQPVRAFQLRRPQDRHDQG